LFTGDIIKLRNAGDKVSAVGEINIVGTGGNCRAGDAVVLPLKWSGGVNDGIDVSIAQSVVPGSPALASIASP